MLSIKKANDLLTSGNYEHALEMYEQLCIIHPHLSEFLEKNISLIKAKLKQNSDVKLKAWSDNVTFKKDLISRYVHKLETISSSKLSGWVYDQTQPTVPLALDVYVNHIKLATLKCNIARNDVIGGQVIMCGFDIDLSEYIKMDWVKVDLCISPTKYLAIDSQVVFNGRLSKIIALEKFSNLIKKNTDPQNYADLWVTNYLLPKVIEDFRCTDSNDYSEIHDLINRSKDGGGISVIIPVYDGYEETVACINSVIDSVNDLKYQLIVVNDHSPNLKLASWLEKAAGIHGFKLIKTHKNLGFPGAVNCGISECLNDDVIILNSDTVVPNHWIDQLSEIASADPYIGTVTPFSNNATICSYPLFCQDNSLPNTISTERLNRLFNQINCKKYVDIPTAHGFCMLIKRTLINEIGLFDEETWGRGYAEENDFSMRALSHGWRNVLAANTFVQHLGSVSFSTSTPGRLQENLKKLNDIYPDYSQRIQHFILEDPIKIYRDRVSKEILKKELAASDQLRLLFVCHSIGGGSEIAVKELAANLQLQNINPIGLIVLQNRQYRLFSYKSNISIDVPDLGHVISILQELGINHVHYQHVIDFDDDVWGIPKAINCQYDVSIHDYYYVCPRVNLIDGSGVYCKEPSVSDCNVCIEKNGVHLSSYKKIDLLQGGVFSWRKFFKEKLDAARAVFVPDIDVKARYGKYLSTDNFYVRPHPERLVSTKTGFNQSSITNVLFIGAIGEHKGYKYLINCARVAQEKNLPLKFHVLGHTVDDVTVSKMPNIIMHGTYTRENVLEKICGIDATVAAILSVWPETFCYTLSEVLMAGLKVVCFDMGAQKNRLPKGAGLTVTIDDDYFEICSKFMEADKLPSLNLTVGHQYQDYLNHYYVFNKSTLK